MWPYIQKNVKVVLYKDFDANKKNKKHAFDLSTDGHIYKILKVHNNNFVDLQNIDDESIIIKQVDGQRIKILK